MSNGTTELDRPVPLYMQVVRQLRAQIASGELRDGDRLPSQRQMMARWHISMQTASKVIGAMKTEGIAVPSVGRDTLVAPGAAARIAAAAQGASHVPAASLPPAPGGAVTAVTAGKTAAPAPVAEILGIPSGRRALRRAETRGEDGHAASITVSWYPPAIADRAPRLADDQPLPAGTLAYIAEVTGNRLARVDEDHAAGPAEADAAAALGIAPGSPVLLSHARQYTADGKLIEYAETTAAAGHWHSRTYTITGN
jgi:DNA-binding GntR family transcriptional regulator